MPIEDRLHVGGRVAEIACKLDFLVSDLRHAREGPFEIVLHLIRPGLDREPTLSGRTGGGRGPNWAGPANGNPSGAQRLKDLARSTVFILPFRSLDSRR